jgi:argininosuccinate synthase
MMRRAVLAYSGGLDTSVAIRWLIEQGYDVFAVAVDVGQQEDVGAIQERGLLAGAAEVRVIPAEDRFAGEFLTRAVKAGGSLLDPDRSVRARSMPGGPSPTSVRAQAQAIDAELASRNHGARIS